MHGVVTLSILHFIRAEQAVMPPAYLWPYLTAVASGPSLATKFPSGPWNAVYSTYKQAHHL